ncbi:MAG: CBS domain-containing protein [Candidatus Woesearchaeota archaeon]
MSYNRSDSMQVSEIMTRKPVVIQKGTSIKKAAETMKRFNVGSVPVLDKRKVVGFFTGDDMVFKVLAEGKVPSKTLVDEIMIQDVISITPASTVKEAMEMLAENDIKRLPVIDKEKNLVGFVTIKDILRIEPTMMDLAIEKIRFDEDRRQEAIRKYVEQDDILSNI